MSFADCPTEKQYNYACEISEGLGIELPNIFTKSAYRDYIGMYNNAYKRSKQQYELEEEEDE